MYTNSLFICEKDDISCDTIPNCKRIVITKINITELYKTIDEYINNTNIYIDSRCSEFIIYSFIKYSIYVYIYNVINNRIENIFIWARNIIKYNINTYNIIYVKKILFLYLFFNYYMKFITDKPFFQPSEAHKVISSSSNDIIKVDFILKYINQPFTINDFDKDVYTMVFNIVDFKNLDNIQQLPKEVSLKNIQASLSTLITQEYVLKW